MAEINRDRQHRAEPFALGDFALHRWPLVDGGSGESMADVRHPVTEEDLAWEEVRSMRHRTMHKWGEAAGVVQGEDAAAAMVHLNGHREEV